MEENLTRAKFLNKLPFQSFELMIRQRFERNVFLADLLATSKHLKNSDYTSRYESLFIYLLK